MIHYTLYIIHYILYIIHYILYIIYYILYIIHYILYIIHYILYIIYYTLYIIYVFNVSTPNGGKICSNFARPHRDADKVVALTFFRRYKRSDDVSAHAQCM